MTSEQPIFLVGGMENRAFRVVILKSVPLCKRPLGRTAVRSGRDKLDGEFGLFRVSLPVSQIQVEKRKPAIQLLAILDRSDKHNGIRPFVKNLPKRIGPQGMTGCRHHGYFGYAVGEQHPSLRVRKRLDFRFVVERVH